jgi:hypothetical protein
VLRIAWRNSDENRGRCRGYAPHAGFRLDARTPVRSATCCDAGRMLAMSRSPRNRRASFGSFDIWQHSQSYLCRAINALRRRSIKSNGPIDAGIGDQYRRSLGEPGITWQRRQVCAGHSYLQRINCVMGVPDVIASSLTGMGRGLPHVSAGFLRAGWWCLGLGRPGVAQFLRPFFCFSQSGISRSRQSGQTYPASRRDPRQSVWHYRVRTSEAKSDGRQR